ncbi:transglycosylase domain-containing protein [Spirochaeta africana]|uniref:Penicillin-binding protein, 1A family n=1 Tax=Spirochaeta africana (strain ATCC 700263 / DSM 8902 / Z-7692) TaxID=889378 RepID=H9UG07_SPIAZ|nr:PBP1A family penicillin-binding protein [Spirochaeta africana]AFG36450.1 penicillin-binding protein, 1A family [Spirochaeta africana DSM 8902]
MGNRPRGNHNTISPAAAGILRVVYTATGVVLAGIGIFLVAALLEAPEIDLADDPGPDIVLYDTNEDEIELTEGRFTPLPRMPAALVDAIIAVEDRRFFEHWGIDPNAILRAALANLRNMSVVQGGSTLTQQLARTLFLGREQTLQRKIQEAYIALRLEQRYSKAEILELYLNHVYFGSGSHGAAAAARRYFDQDVAELELHQAAMLAGIPRSPAYYTPAAHPEIARRRRATVLHSMYDMGYISQGERDAALDADLEVLDRREALGSEFYFIDYVYRQVEQLFGDSPQSQLHVYTTLDPDAHQAAEQALQSMIDDGILPTDGSADSSRETGSEYADEQPQAAIVLLDAESGGIRAMIGGRGSSEFNRALYSPRQPGSAFKPFVYSAAIKRGDHPGMIVNDLPVYEEKTEDRYEVWPRNFDDVYRGLVSYRTALERSMNVPAVRIARDIGIPELRSVVEDFGFSTLHEDDGEAEHYSFALGGLTEGVTPLEMAAAYSVFATGGYRVPPHAVVRIADRSDNTLYSAADSTLEHRRESILTEAEAFLISDMLRTAVERGTGTMARLTDHTAAGKTGTSDDNTDAWFTGYTRELVGSVWLGDDRSKPMQYNSHHELTGVHASQLWGRLMEHYLDSRESAEDSTFDPWEPPEGLQQIDQHRFTGTLDETTGSPEFTAAPQPSAVPRLPPQISLPEDRPLALLYDDADRLLPDREDPLPAPRFLPADFDPDRPGYRFGAARIPLGSDATVFPDGESFTGTYKPAAGEPVQHIDPETGLPSDPHGIQLQTATRIQQPIPLGAAAGILNLPQGGLSGSPIDTPP